MLHVFDLLLRLSVHAREYNDAAILGAIDTLGEKTVNLGICLLHNC